MADKSDKKENNFKIEVVDNHVQTVISMCSILEFQGFRCIQAYNSEDAIQFAKRENPDLLIVDILMNGKSGYDIAEALPLKKIILMTAFDRDYQRIMKLPNIEGVLDKPISSSELIRLVRKSLGLPKK